jgi:hypothetical protein
MSRLFKLLLVLSAFAVVLVSTAVADTKDIDQTNFNWARYKANTDPGVTALGTAPWGSNLGADSITGLLPTPIDIVLPDSIRWLGIDNVDIPKNVKIITVYLQGTNLDRLQLTDRYGVAGGIKTPGALLETSAHSPTQFIMRFGFDPQPDWEVLKLTCRGGNANITHFYIVADCNQRPVPTLTQYGLAVLVLLLIATAFFVYRHRRRVIA